MNLTEFKLDVGELFYFKYFCTDSVTLFKLTPVLCLKIIREPFDKQVIIFSLAQPD